MHYEVSYNSEVTAEKPVECRTRAEAEKEFRDMVRDYEDHMTRADEERAGKAKAFISLDLIGDDGEVIDTLKVHRIGW